MNIERLRSETAGCEERIHLNNAGAALVPEPVARRIRDHFIMQSRSDGYRSGVSVIRESLCERE
jgi:cysteine desulfurase / selenocysteine lyase